MARDMEQEVAAPDAGRVLREDLLRILRGGLKEKRPALARQRKEGRERQKMPLVRERGVHRDWRISKPFREDEMRLARWVRIRLQGVLRILPQSLNFILKDNENSLKGF